MLVTSTYLLDNNVISVAVRPDEARHQIVVNHLRAAGSNYIALPTMAIAEILDGQARVDLSGIALPPSGAAQRARLEQFLLDYPQQFPFDEFAIESYSLIIAKLFVDYANKRGRTFIEKVPEELTERMSGRSLGIDERDLIIASTAIAYNCILATMDVNSGMQNIINAAKDLEQQGKRTRLRTENWTT
jgi:predicted nucleic acid-binding protein